MPAIVDYEQVIAQMQRHRLRCQYYNSGAFGLEAGEPMHFAGWIGPEDPTIRPAALAHARSVTQPYEANLARLVAEVWQKQLPGPAWVMPKANWAYELDFGSKAWMPDALRAAMIDPTQLEGRTNAPAISFNPNEIDRFTPFVQALLERLFGSDFALAFPDYPVACTVHHHKQIWWISSDADFIAAIADWKLDAG